MLGYGVLWVHDQDLYNQLCVCVYLYNQLCVCVCVCTLQTELHCEYTTLHCHQQCIKVPFTSVFTPASVVVSNRTLETFFFFFFFLIGPCLAEVSQPPTGFQSRTSRFILPKGYTHSRDGFLLVHRRNTEVSLGQDKANVSETGNLTSEYSGRKEHCSMHQEFYKNGYPPPEITQPRNHAGPQSVQF